MKKYIYIIIIIVVYLGLSMGKHLWNKPNSLRIADLNISTPKYYLVIGMYKNFVSIYKDAFQSKVLLNRKDISFNNPSPYMMIKYKNYFLNEEITVGVTVGERKQYIEYLNKNRFNLDTTEIIKSCKINYLVKNNVYNYDILKKDKYYYLIHIVGDNIDDINKIKNEVCY